MIVYSCTECFNYFTNGSLASDISIEETAMFLGLIESNWPKKRYRIEPAPEDGSSFRSNCACDCCDTLEEGKRHEIEIMEIN